MPSYHQYIDSPSILETRPETTAAIRLTIARSRMLTETGPARAEILAALKSQGLKPSGPWFMHLLSIDRDLFDFYLCVAVTERVLSTGRVEAHELPAMRAAQAIYRGPYDNLADAWREFDAWMRANGHQPAAERVQRYLTGPESMADPAGWETELTRPLES